MAASLIYKEEAYEIMGACFEVYKEMGPGFLEAVYQECLEMSFSDRSVPFAAKPKVPIEFKSRPLRTKYEPDFVCYGQVVVEIKAVSTLINEHRAQVLNYLSASKHKLGLLVNFGHHPKLEYERFVL